MIELLRTSSNAFLLKLDAQGIKVLLKYIYTILEGNETHVQICYPGQRKNLVIKLDLDAARISITKKVIELYMGKDELEYFKERLNSSLINKYFYPAEICERDYKSKYITIYCDAIF